MEIRIKTIPHDQQRYPTVGDYWFDKKNVLQIRVSDMGNWFYETLVVVHEMVEEALCRHRGLAHAEIDKFDIEYEAKRDRGEVPEDSEPGFDNNAPYLLEHTLATAVEMMMCAKAGIKWNEYNDTVMNMP